MLMTNTHHKGRRVLEDEPTITMLAKRAAELQRDINAALDDLVASDREATNLPAPVVKSLRTALHLYGFCPCRWVQNEANCEF
jgi:hypothetical protein